MPLTAPETFTGERERFGRQRPFENAELTGLFDLLDRQPPGEARIALSQFVREKLRDLFPRGSKRVATVDLTNGLSVEVDVGDLFGAEVFVGHCNEAAILDALIASLPKGAKVVDVGANFGIYSLCAAAIAGSDARGVAFEPAPTAYRLLQGNISRNGFASTFVTRRAAVGAVAGTMQFHVAVDESFSGLRDTGRSPISETVEIDVTTLDTDEDVKALGAITFLKIDTEGGEAGVLQGAQGLIARSSNLAILLEYSVKNLTSEQAAAIQAALHKTMESGLKAWVIDGESRALPLTSVKSLPEGFNGSIFLAAREAAWAKTFVAELRASKLAPSIDAASVTAAVTSLVLSTRQTSQNLSLLQRDLETHNKLSRESIENLEARVALLSLQLEARKTDVAKQAGEVQSLRADIELLSNKDRKKSAVIADLNGVIADRASAQKAVNEELATMRSDFASQSQLRSLLEAELSSANERIGLLELTIADLNSRVADLDQQRLNLVSQATQMEALLEERRSMIRHLQQLNGLLVLGKRQRKV